MRQIVNYFHYAMIFICTPAIWFSPLFLVVISYSYLMLLVDKITVILANNLTKNKDVERIKKVEDEVRELVKITSFKR